MKNNLVVELIKKMPKSDIFACKRWLQSSFQNKREDVKLLFGYLMMHDGKQLDKKKVFAYIYPNEEFLKQRLHTVTSILFKTIEDFLIYQKIQANKIQRSVLLAEVYEERRLERHFDKSWGCLHIV